MPHDASDRLAARVRSELAARKISGRRLSADMGWRYPHLARRLSGEVPFRADELGRIATHLDIPIEQLYENGGHTDEPAKAAG